MRAAIFSGPGAVEAGDRPDPVIVEPTDAVVRVVLGCVCGSDLWYYRGVSPHAAGSIGHEFIGIVEQTGAEVREVRAGNLVVAPFIGWLATGGDPGPRPRAVSGLGGLRARVRLPVGRDGPQEQEQEQVKGTGGLPCLLTRRERGTGDDGCERPARAQGCPRLRPAAPPAAGSSWSANLGRRARRAPR
jgi:hypothetical protein